MTTWSLVDLGSSVENDVRRSNIQREKKQKDLEDEGMPGRIDNLTADKDNQPYILMNFTHPPPIPKSDLSLVRS